MRLLRFVALIAAFACLAALPAQAALLIDIDKSTQRMIVSLDGARLFSWPVSTGATGYDTPSGEFKPFRMERDHFSKEWDDAPMPHSIFFTMQGHAIHGSYHKSIGRPASHGCVRLAPENARILFDLVKQEKMANTRVVLRGQAPTATPPAVASRQPPQQRERDRMREVERAIERDYQRRYGTIDNDDDFFFSTPQPRRRVARDGWREYTDGDRVYYYRDGRYYVSPPPPPRYGTGRPYASPYGW